ncbi:hypothetical protein [Terricaulis silvestris]|uniref:DUF2846 domain-containing protein n=1 Tax=Terricaulis silvestris TaxID=2686094 RepID=A0A6I6MR45_9CAUL|nr:hypothetical protein [Terricaulis silvestris]QGZ95918.1 hypothetical protein DSM104635_02773 [Terricaulis silvestris]
MVRYLLLVGVAVIVGLVVFGAMRSLFGDSIVNLITLVIVAVCVVIVWRNLQLNRKVTDATPQQRTAALTFAPDAGKAALYVYRTQFIGKAVGVNLDIDGRQAAQIKSPRFTRVALTPGVHKIELYLGTPDKKKPGANTQDLNVAAGDVIVLKLEIEPQMVGTVIKATRVEAQKAGTEIGRAKMVAPDVAEL